MPGRCWMPVRGTTRSRADEIIAYDAEMDRSEQSVKVARVNNTANTDVIRLISYALRLPISQVSTVPKGKVARQNRVFRSRPNGVGVNQDPLIFSRWNGSVPNPA